MTTTTSVKTSELIGAALDWAVAKCEGRHIADPEITSSFLRQKSKGSYNYSTDWSQGGPIIERERIKIFPNVGGTWSAQIRHTESHPLVSHSVLAGWTNSHGPAPLIAACRCYVACKLGDTVNVPEEL